MLRSRLLLPLLTLCIALFAQAFAAAADSAPVPGMHSLATAMADLYGSAAAPAGDSVTMTIQDGDPQPVHVTTDRIASDSFNEPGSTIEQWGWRTFIADKPLYMEGQAAFRPGS